MTQIRSTDLRRPATRPEAGGLTVFASVVLLVGGAGQATMGVSALALPTWSLVHMLLGGALLACGVGILSRPARWLRPAALGAAILTVVADFLWAAAAPVPSVALIALALFASWALSAESPGSPA